MRNLFTPERIFCFDASVLMQIAHDYPADIFPTLWQNLEELIEKESIHAVQEVRLEIEAGNDDLVKWAKRNGGLFVPVEIAHQTRAQGIIQNHPTLVDTLRQTPQADPFVIGHALCERCVVVTMEKRAQQGQKREKIPDVCQKEGVECINSLQDLFREFRWSF